MTEKTRDAPIIGR